MGVTHVWALRVSPVGCFEMLPKSAQASIRKEQLRSLHLEIASFRELVGATQIEVSATAGALQCKDSRHLAISAEDVALRLGQLLCGWCSSQERAPTLDGDDEDDAVDGQDDGKCANRSSSSCKAIAQ
eukprot:s2148_g4.t1